MLKAVHRPKIRDVVAEQLKALIRTQKLRPGDRLPTENELAVQFGVSRLSLREATKALEFLGIVESKPGRGLTVGQVSLERMTEYLSFHPALQKASPEQLIDSRIIVETGVLPHVIQRMQQDPSIYETLSAINHRLREARELQQWIEHDIDFHHSLLELSGLTPLLAFSDLLTVFFHHFRESVEHGEWAQGIESHQKLIDALRDGDLQRAIQELSQHIGSHRLRAATAKTAPAV